MTRSSVVAPTTISLGDVEITRIVEIVLDNGDPALMFPDYDAAVWDSHQELLHPADRSGDAPFGFTMSHQSWLLRSGDRTILLDTGLGNGKERTNPSFSGLDQPYLEGLAQAGVAPEDVDLVLITHLHTDHVGWNTVRDGDAWIPTFPNATYVLSRADLDYFDPGRRRGGQRVSDAFMRNVWDDSVQPVIDDGRVESWDGEYLVDASLRLVAAPGHTPGNAVLALASGPDRAMFVGDLLHSPVQVALPDWNNCMCEDPAASRNSRHRILGLAADHRALVFGGHFGGDQGAEVARTSDGFTIRGWRP